MKKLHILIPSLVATASMPFIGLVGCRNSDKTQIPAGYLDVKRSATTQKDTLIGFDNQHQTLESLNGYSTLAIPKNVEKLDGQAFIYEGDVEHNAPLAIKKITFKSGCICSYLGRSSFKGCTNLETVVFPPKLSDFASQAGSTIFSNCSSLSVIDLRKIEGTVQFKDSYWTGPQSANFSKKGKILYKKKHKGQSDFSDFLYNTINAVAGTDWRAIGE